MALAERPRKDAILQACKAVGASLGYQALKKEQLEVIVKFIQGEDVFAVLPTGFGKSLCYACLPGVFDALYASSGSVVVVISPLRAIIKDQVSIFSTKGIRVAYITGDQKDDIVKDRVMSGHFQLVFFTPEELLLNRQWRQCLSGPPYSERLRGLVIDEAHTIKKWGESFRKVLLRIGEIRSLISSCVCVMALTATATKALRQDVQKIIGMKSPAIIALSPSKPNIMFAMRWHETVVEAFQPMLKQIEKDRVSFNRTIIYCRRFSDCGTLYMMFRQFLGQGFTEPVDAPDLPQFRLVDMYHSSTDPAVQEMILHRFSVQSSLRVVVSTVAFGMGIDCADVRQVVHLGPPDDVEAYIQETGRAGCDGQNAIAVLLLIKGARYEMDTTLHNYCKNTSVCRRNFLFSVFEGFQPGIVSPPYCCDICRSRCSPVCTEESFSF